MSPKPERFWDKVQFTGTCWLWTACTNAKGYGQFKVEGRMVGAHRWAYEQVYGAIPEGLQIDHLCRTVNCVYPLHLEVVTSRVNTLRGNGRAGINARKTHCPNGHEYSGENLRVDAYGKRYCRTCSKVNRHLYD